MTKNNISQTKDEFTKVKVFMNQSKHNENITKSTISLMDQVKMSTQQKRCKTFLIPRKYEILVNLTSLVLTFSLK